LIYLPRRDRRLSCVKLTFWRGLCVRSCQRSGCPSVECRRLGRTVAPPGVRADSRSNRSLATGTCNSQPSAAYNALCRPTTASQDTPHRLLNNNKQATPCVVMYAAVRSTAHRCTNVLHCACSRARLTRYISVIFRRHFSASFATHGVIQLCFKGQKVKGRVQLFIENPSHSYEASPAIWDHTVFIICHTTQVIVSRFNSSQTRWYWINLPRRHRRLSWLS